MILTQEKQKKKKKLKFERGVNNLHICPYFQHFNKIYR